MVRRNPPPFGPNRVQMTVGMLVLIVIGVLYRSYKDRPPAASQKIELSPTVGPKEADGWARYGFPDLAISVKLPNRPHFGVQSEQDDNPTWFEKTWTSYESDSEESAFTLERHEYESEAAASEIAEYWADDERKEGFAVAKKPTLFGVLYVFSGIYNGNSKPRRLHGIFFATGSEVKVFASLSPPKSANGEKEWKRFVTSLEDRSEQRFGDTLTMLNEKTNL